MCRPGCRMTRPRLVNEVSMLAGFVPTSSHLFSLLLSPMSPEVRGFFEIYSLVSIQRYPIVFPYTSGMRILGLV